MKRARIIAVLIVAVCTAGSVWATEEPPPKPVFPEVVFTPFDGGEAMTMSAFRGRPVLVTFWASWCGPCRVELPELSKLYGDLAGRGFVLITVNVDRNPNVGRQFLAQLGLNLPVYRLNPRDLQALGINALPANILLDAEGRFVQAYKGYTPAVVEDVRRMVLEMTAPKEP